MDGDRFAPTTSPFACNGYISIRVFFFASHADSPILSVMFFFLFFFANSDV